ncbi:hypothetical protein GUITHDRAFT_112399 [Guillardia theta CCMP2712]|uniref:DUF2723 domain-containing protein n=1 Tax=Guillardia theta (strain CCMP2712) TaxID=905079 RepID=L1J030_GUITC|nr:hypothetical protein GUITHDRAFT_112399 [Guillardia theta CCMP2712]EKX41692.1 hypothetical protein GUITHDRAFT_112399 [Guillardia theta CCMP2712]|eukprot:XP_005828672.1 hypothetical protein GUITHDRAFT_112399 [Guillardia theta CCMP2712]
MSGKKSNFISKRNVVASWVPTNLEEEFADEFKHVYFIAVLLFSVILSVYVATMHRSVSGGDNGELLGCACELGIAHPPGYPTFTVLGHFFVRFFPFGTPAFRVAFMSGTCDALAGVLVMLSVHRWFLLESTLEKKSVAQAWVGSVWPSLLAGGLYSLCPLVWMYSVQAEVFAMNNFFAALLIYLILRFNEKRSLKLACLGSFSIGLGLTNQHTLVLFALPVVVWSLFVGRNVLINVRAISLLSFCGLVGLTPYVFLFTHAKYAPLGSWGDTSTFDGFMTHFLRKEYGTFQLYSGNDMQQKQVLVATLRYFKQPHIISFMILGKGLKPFLERISCWKAQFVIPAVLLILFAQVGINYKSMDQSKNLHVRDLGRKHLEFLPPNTILISQGDLVTNSMRYLQRCEKYRTDVLLLDETMMTYKWMRNNQGPRMKKWKIKFPNELHSPNPMANTYTMEEFLAVNGRNPKFPVFKAGAWLGGVMGRQDSGVPSWHTVPVGLVSAVMRKGRDMSNEEWLEWFNKIDLFPQEPDFFAFDDRTWEWLMRRIILEWRAKVGFRFSNLAVEKANALGERAWLDRAETYIADVLRLEEIAHGHEPKTYILADLYNALGMLQVHIQHFLTSREEIIESNRKIAKFFALYVEKSPKPDISSSQEASLVTFLQQNPSYDQMIIPKENLDAQTAELAKEKAKATEPVSESARSSKQSKSSKKGKKAKDPNKKKRKNAEL